LIATGGPVRSTVVRAFDGLELAVVIWPGFDGRPGVFFMHATGFVKEIWAPVVTELRRRGVETPCVAADQRGHGDSDTPEPPFAWEALGRDVAAVRAELDGRWVGVGHSSGGAAIAMAQVASPGLFEALLLIEPIVFPPPHLRLEDHPFATLALRRRYAFADRDAALANFAGKGPFARWDPRSLEAYVDGALREDEGRLLLKCEPAVEAEFYRTGNSHDTWEHLGSIAAPVTLMAGSESSSHPASFMRLLQGRFQDATVTVVDGATHFVPMERPDLVAGAIIDLGNRVQSPRRR
jgi:pimeloyl-ACP methyl ester carboxylesterase